MLKKKNIFINRCEAQRYIEKKYAGSPFLEKFNIAIGVAKKLQLKSDVGQLVSDGDVNEELKYFNKITDKYIENIKILREQTKEAIEIKHINDGGADSNPKPVLNILIEDLEKIRRYCIEGRVGWGVKDIDDFKKLEIILAQEFESAGYQVKKSGDSEFAEVLKAFHICSGIKKYEVEGGYIDIDGKYIKRIQDKATCDWNDLWRTSPKKDK